MIYLFVLVLIIFLSFHFDVKEKKKGRDAWYRFVMILLILIAGLRWRLGSDTTQYIHHFYYDTPKLTELTSDDLLFGGKPFWILLNSLVYTLNGKFYMVQLIHAAFVNILIFNYIKRHCNYIFLCVFLYCFWIYFGYNMEMLKASMSIAVCLYANDYAFEKKWVKAFSLYFVAIFFHPQAIALLFTPLFASLKFDRRMIIISTLFFLFGYTLQFFLGSYLDLLSNISDEAILQKATSVSENENFISQTKGFLYQLVATYIPILYTILSLYYVKRCCKKNMYERVEPFVLMGFCFTLISINVFIFVRIVDFYLIYNIFLFTYIFENVISSKAFSFRPSAYFKVFVIFLPLLISIQVSRARKMYRFYPYYSVIEMKEDPDREEQYMESLHPTASREEY